MADALVVSGSGPYADAWHDFAATSARLAQIIADAGWSVAITGDVDGALQAPRSRLLVVNVGRRSPARAGPVLAAIGSGLSAHLNAGGAVLGMHASITALDALPQWRQTFGGAWLPDQTMHPPKGRATLDRTGVEHPISTGLPVVTVDDERYSFLATEPDIEVLYTHRHEGRRHPVVWARADGGRVVYDALGHDTDSFDSPDHRELVQRSIRWLMRD